MYIHLRYTVRWDPAKSRALKARRGRSFEELLGCRVIGHEINPGRPGQTLVLFLVADYIWVVPSVIDGGEMFFKTLYPSRKHTKIWRNGDLG